jgi:hypothetical protein
MRGESGQCIAPGLAEFAATVAEKSVAAMIASKLDFR